MRWRGFNLKLALKYLRIDLFILLLLLNFNQYLFTEAHRQIASSNDGSWVLLIWLKQVKCSQALWHAAETRVRARSLKGLQQLPLLEESGNWVAKLLHHRHQCMQNFKNFKSNHCYRRCTFHYAAEKTASAAVPATVSLRPKWSFPIKMMMATARLCPGRRLLLLMLMLMLGPGSKDETWLLRIFH